MSPKKSSGGKGTVFDGIGAAAEMLGFLDEKHREKLLAAVAKQKPELVAKIREKLVSLDSLLSWDAQSFQKLISEVGIPKIALAFKTASDAFKNQVRKNLSARSLAILEEEIKNLGLRKKSEIEEIQKKIMQVAELLKSGKT